MLKMEPKVSLSVQNRSYHAIIVEIPHTYLSISPPSLPHLRNTLFLYLSDSLPFSLSLTPSLSLTLTQVPLGRDTAMLCGLRTVRSPLKCAAHPSHTQSVRDTLQSSCGRARVTTGEWVDSALQSEICCTPFHAISTLLSIDYRI